MILDYILIFISNVVSIIGSYAIFWLPIILIPLSIRLWRHYLVEKYVSSIQWTMFEVRIPRNIEKSPQAMELFITTALYQATGTHWSEKYFKGSDPRAWSSMELVSIEGRIHFLFRVETGLKDYVISQMYAQYPQVEISEVEDYVFNVPAITKGGEWNAWGCEYTLAKPDPLPILTYIDFGLDKNPKEEHKVDPITSLIEFMGSIGEGEQVWIQIIVQATTKMYHTHGTLFGHHDFNTESRSYVEELLEKYRAKKATMDDLEMPPKMPKHVEEAAEGVTRKNSKAAFDVGIRCMYVAKKNAFNAATRKSLRMIFWQYGSPNLNSFRRVNSTQFDIEPIQDMFGGLNYMKNQILDHYRERVMFHPQMRKTWGQNSVSKFFKPNLPPQVCILNAEELATIYHFPGQVSETPTFKRIESRTAKAPFNLPS